MSLRSRVTNLLKYEVVQFMKDQIIPTDANTYVTIGRPIVWGGDSVEILNEVENIELSTNYMNQSRRNMMAAKKVQAADISYVVPRIDWANNTIYDMYQDHNEMHIHLRKNRIGVVYANADLTLSGNVNVASGGVDVIGSGTTFVGNVFIGDVITINAQSRTVSSISGAETLTVSSAFTNGGNGNTIVVVANNRLAKNTAGLFFGNTDIGTLVSIENEIREVIDVKSNYVVMVNTKFNNTYSGNTNILKITDKYPLFANNFYVRNSRDQVFKCMHTPGNTTDSFASTQEPTINIDGQLPESPFIETADGYKWKYLYTIPYGLKQKFFTKDWMPVVREDIAVNSAVDGRIDVIDILSSGSGYYLGNGYSGNIASYDIVTITGDGTGATATARIENGEITELNILDGGEGYTKANVIINDVNQLPTGTDAAFDVVVGPPGGHGFDPVKELGCYSLMLSVELNNIESGKIPVTSLSGNFDYRQICIVRDPIQTSTGLYANGSVYRTTTKFTLSDPGISNYQNDETVYVGTGLGSAVFSGTVAHWDPNTNELFLINLDGSYADLIGQEIKSVTTTAAILGIEESELVTFSGDLLYIENRLPIVRNTDQVEQIRVVFSF